MDGGVYIAVFHLSRCRRVRVGKLGWRRFAAGWYLYVGTAQRGRDARLRRHARRDKRPRWHIDYLSAEAEMIGAILVPGPKRRECELAGQLADLCARAAPGFGASDCRCGGHLFFAEHWPRLRGTRRRVAARRSRTALRPAAANPGSATPCRP